MHHFLLKICFVPFFLFLLNTWLFPAQLHGQDRCGTMDLLNKRFTQTPGLKGMFNEREARLQQIVKQRIASGQAMKTAAGITIPVVFHIVLNRQSNVTDAQIMAQLDTINKDYSGRNAGAARIPDHFRALFGQSGIQFCLAQRTPDDAPSSGIVRYTTTRSAFDYTTNQLKHAESGGADAWDTDRYLNIWICDLSGSTLGYATFPADGVQDEQGVAIDYASLPGGNATGFNGGKTLTHELGHYFSLYHIWGDDNGSCSGTDEIDDTPNQSNSNNTCRTGIVTDNCTPAAPGIMYQNFMDYTPDACLLMFTKMQVARMEAAYSTYRALLSVSNACTPVNIRDKDASIRQIQQPEQRLCENTFTPQVRLANRGRETLTSVLIHTVIDDGTATSTRWTGALATYAETTVTLPTLTTVEGTHTLRVYTTNPNAGADEDSSNDEQTLAYIYYEPITGPVIESFEALVPPTRWDIVNPDSSITWEKTTDAAKTGTSAVRIRNFGNEAIGQQDLLRAPAMNIAGVDSAYISFQVAAATYTSPSATGNVWDTLQVLISTDCGQSYTSVYKKWGSSLTTVNAAIQTEFRPQAAEWRQERINISNFIPNGEILVAFMNTNGNENDIFLDDVNINTVIVNSNLKEARFLVSPNPTPGLFTVEFYPHPQNLRSVSIYSLSGQKLAERILVPGQVSTNVYTFNLTNYAAGLYIVKAEFTDRVLTKKIIKY